MYCFPFYTTKSPIVTECKMPKMRMGSLLNWWGGWICSNIYFPKQTSFLKKTKQQFDPKSSTVLSNVSPSVGAPVRVYLHSLVRRLLYSHLTPSTLSSPFLPPSSVLQCTSILTLPLLLPHRSMGEYVWRYDQCMSAALPRETPQIESLFSLPPRAALARRHAGAPPLENDHPCSSGQCWGWQGAVVWICVFYPTHSSFGTQYCTNIKTYTYCEGILYHWWVLTGSTTGR